MKKLEIGKEEKNQNKIHRESGTKEKDGDKDINRNKQNRQALELE